MEKAVSVLHGYTWKNKEIKVKVQFDDLAMFVWPVVQYLSQLVKFSFVTLLIKITH